MKNKITAKWVIALVILLLLNTIYPSSAVNAKEVKTHDSVVLTLSPEQVGAHYKKLKGYKIHTVVWLNDYALGNPYAQAREDSEKYEFAIHPSSKEKPQKDSYIEIEAIIGGDFLGYIDLNDAVILSKGAQSGKVLKQIDKQELANALDIEKYAAKALETSEESTYLSIAKGASGDAVVKLQKQLVALGYLALPVDGSFGPGTEQAVKAFQSAHQLKSTGIANKETHAAIKNAKAALQKKWESFVSLKKGASGDGVVEIQGRLAELGYLASSVDGSFGPGTEQSVRNFQAANGLSPDGVVNKNTYKKMFSAEVKRYVAPTPTVAPEQSSSSVITKSSEGPLVWITKTGKKYHSKSKCGATKTSWQVTLAEAEARGLAPCAKCW